MLLATALLFGLGGTSVTTFLGVQDGDVRCGGFLIKDDPQGASIVSARHCFNQKPARARVGNGRPIDLGEGDGALLLSGDRALVRVRHVGRVTPPVTTWQYTLFAVMSDTALSLSLVDATSSDCQTLKEEVAKEIRDKNPTVGFAFAPGACAKTEPPRDLLNGDSGSPILDKTGKLLGTLSGDDGRGLLVYEPAGPALRALSDCAPDWTTGCVINGSPIGSYKPFRLTLFEALYDAWQRVWPTIDRLGRSPHEP